MLQCLFLIKEIKGESDRTIAYLTEKMAEQDERIKKQQKRLDKEEA